MHKEIGKALLSSVGPSTMAPACLPAAALQIVKAFLDYSMFHQLAGYGEMWFPYELKAVERIYQLPLEGEAIEMVAYVANTLGHIKFVMGHLDLAIDLGKGQRGGKRGKMQDSPKLGFLLPGFRAYRMWSLLRNPNEYCSVLCTLSSALLLRNRYWSQSRPRSQEPCSGLIVSWLMGSCWVPLGTLLLEQNSLRGHICPGQLWPVACDHKSVTHYGSLASCLPSRGKGTHFQEGKGQGGDPGLKDGLGGGLQQNTDRKARGRSEFLCCAGPGSQFDLC